MKKNILFLIFGCVISFTCMALMPLSVFAANDCVSTEKGNKSYYNYGTNSFYDRIVEKNTQTAADIFAGEVSMQKFLVDKSAKILNDSNRCHVPIPNTVMDGTTSESPRMSCWDWFLGNDKAKWEGITFNPNHMNGNANCENSPDQVGSYLESLGYTAEKNPSGGLSGGQKQGCITGYVSENPPDGGAPKRVNISNQLCFYLYEEGGKQYIDLWATDNNGWAIGDDNAENYLFDWCSTDSGYCAFDNAGEGNIVFYIKNSGGPTGYLDKGAIALGIDELVTFDGFVSEWQDGLSRWNNEATNDYKIQGEIKGGSNDSDDGLVATYNSVYKKGAKADIAAGILGTKSNPYLGKPTPRGFTSAEVYNTYLEYLSDKNHVTFLCSEDHDFENDNNYKWFHLDNVKYQDKFRNDCWVQGDGMRYTGAEIGLSSTRDPNTGVITNTEYYFTKENMTLEQIVKQMNSLRKNLSDDEIGKLGDNVASVTDSSEDGETEPTCMNTAATSLGWILCPVLDAFGGATDWAYNELVKPALQIEPQLFTGGNEGTQRAWETFRSIANVFFIILFLVVIFSQLTGVGIDNYGIKKILPKLILAAVLINLSYLICIIFVDVSNILGNGLQNMFTDLGSQLSIPDSLEGGIGLSGVAQSTLTSIVVLIALIGGVATAITAAGGVVAFLVSLLIIALSALVALFFLFLLLAAREAAIIVLIVLSPLAFACYILPNTQNTFKKWYQLGWRLLMVYPIAGLLIGGGDFVSKLLLSAGVGGQGFFSAFAAIIAGIIPIFFIPTVLKQAFALMGGLGAKISGLGKSVGGRISGNVGKSIQGSERFKNYQADRERNRKLNFARRTNERLSRRNSETLSDRQRRQLASARMIESAEYAENLKRDAIVDGNRYEAMRAGIRAKDEDQAINDRLALMRSSGESGGIMVGGQKVAYTLDNLNARMQELERKSRSAALSSDEQSEMAALARGMVSQKGGAGMLNNIVRNAGNQDATGKHQLNANFMSSLGQIYNNDSTVAGKMTEKDGGMGGYMERFMPGGDGVNRNESFDDYFADNSNNGYAGNASRRIKSHEAGLNQSGEAFRYYLGTLTKEQAQSIMDNQQLLNSLDVDNRTEFISHARTLGVTGPSARDVNVINVPHTP